jgi:hypothetical protein
MDRAKYIIIEVSLLETPIIFSPTLTHSDVARSLTGGDRSKVLSAGFVTITPKRDYGIDVDCFGRSESLDLGSRETDGAILARTLEIE